MWPLLTSITPAKFRVLKQSKLEKKAKPGTIIYGCIQYGYGLAKLDTKVTGIPHASFTLKANGDYPFFTMPITDVREIKPRRLRSRLS